MEPEIVFEAQQDPTFYDAVAALPEGERLRSCLQCGSCGGTCPVARILQHTPRRLFAMVRAGMKREVLTSLTPWVCSSCYACTVNCPAGIKITDIMYALKRMAIKEGLQPKESDANRFAEQFTDVVCAHGRASEFEAMMRYMMFSHPGRLLGKSAVGLEMMGRGRMPLLPHRIQGLESFRRLVARARELDEVKP
ncbi:MAG: 4Fe-4S dicluster domain-containing protein [Deltaproteobacteria bacterium]|nr:4Fe-4S dicluster domain-containing protein [Deltaproteobacteria bacterium]